MKPRPMIAASLLAALVVGLGVSVSQRGPSPASGGSTSVFTPAVSVVAPAGAQPAGDVQPMVRTTATGSVQGRIVAAATAALSPDAAALLAEQSVVQQLVKDAAITLTPEQWTEFAAVTWRFQTVRQTFEATIATVSAQDRQRVEIPVYPAVGDALRERFYGELRERLGAETADALANRAGAALEGYFGGFGVSVQTLEFTAAAGSASADAQVTRTAHYWNSTDSRETLTRRRETHFPRMEDPSGERWGPFLNLLAHRAGDKAGS